MDDLSAKFLPLLEEYERLSEKLYGHLTGIVSFHDITKINDEEIDPVKKAIFELTLASFSPEFFKKYNEHYVIEKIHAWYMHAQRKNWENLKKNFIDECYDDDFREAIFSCIGISYHPTDKK